jgi:hypothetical protein
MKMNGLRNKKQLFLFNPAKKPLRPALSVAPSTDFGYYFARFRFKVVLLQKHSITRYEDSNILFGQQRHCPALFPVDGRTGALGSR